MMSISMPQIAHKVGGARHKQHKNVHQAKPKPINHHKKRSSKSKQHNHSSIKSPPVKNLVYKEFTQNNTKIKQV